MKEALLELFKLLIQLGRISTDDPTQVEKLKQKIALQKDVIDTMHGDSDFNDLEVVESLDDLCEILATSTPHPDYEEIPDDLDDNSSIEAAGGDGVPGETADGKKKSTAAAAKDNLEEGDDDDDGTLTDNLDKENQEEAEAEEDTEKEEEEEDAESPAQKRKREREREEAKAKTAKPKKTK